jgi:hypothetical protein
VSAPPEMKIWDLIRRLGSVFTYFGVALGLAEAETAATGTGGAIG